jgi:phosphoribosylamine---glycine ligase
VTAPGDGRKNAPPESPRTILVLGAGAREHALAWSLRRDPGVREVIVAPGNPGMADVATLAPEVVATDSSAVARLVAEHKVGLVVVGPEGPLVDGIADELEAKGIAVFGPGAAAAHLEGSKAFCREVAGAAGVPMAEGAAFQDSIAAFAAARRIISDGVDAVIKVDGLAAGKGVTICSTINDVKAAIRDAMISGAYGSAGRTVVVERALGGREASVIAICDESAILALPAARDYKRIGDGDAGPNTGGMGAYSPLEDLADDEVAQIVEGFHRPLLAELRQRGITFRGVLYTGLMLTVDGPRLLECNVRFGDPETQAVLPRLDVPLAPLLAAASRGRLADAARELGVEGVLLPVQAGARVAVVLAAAGYPEAPEMGAEITGLDAARQDGALVFCAGVAAPRAGVLATAGGRVISVVGEGDTTEAAAMNAYGAADRIQFAGRQLRRDIGREAAPALVAAGAPSRNGIA